MKTMKKRLQKWILGGLTVGFVCSAALGVGLTFVGENAVANEEKEPILAPRYIYDTSLNDAILGVGSKIALPKATIVNTLRDEPAVTASVTVSWNGNVVDGYDEAETYEDDFTFSKAGEYEIVYSYAQSEDTPKDTYTITVKDSAPVITAVERTPYIVPTGTELTKPQTTAVCGDETLDSEVNIYYPNESAYRFQETTLDESGLYEIEFKTVWNDTVYSYVKSVYAYGINATFTGSETPYYGAPSFEKTLQTMKSYTENQTDKLSWTDGLNVSFGKGDVFAYDKPIRLSELGSTDKLVQFYVEPTGAATVYVYVELVDVNDENNVLSVRFSSVPMMAGSKSYRTYVSTAATGIGQVYAGRKDDILYVDRLSAGTYTCIDVSGLQDTNFYHPLSFAYDEATKQVYTSLVNREPNLIVADLDDTETYFEKVWSTKQIAGGQTGYFTTAWDGFSSDEVYVRMRVEGSYVGSVQTTITKIGNHDLQPRFASLLPAPNVRHEATWMPSFAEDADYSAYYGAPSFEDELFDMESCDKTGTDQFTWTDGINVSLDVGDTFHYPDLVDLSTLSATDKLFQMLVKPTGNQSTTLYVELIDENDPENILSIRFVSFNVDSADKNKYRVYATAAALKIGQPYTGVQTSTINTLYYNRPTGGYYTSVDVSGLTSNIYYPLNFAYDETTKQVLFGFANRTTLGVVADMDDTTTRFESVYNGSQRVDGGQTGYFTAAWNGFSSDKVYLRMRVDGTFENTLDTCILRIGSEDLSKTGNSQTLMEANSIQIDFKGYDRENLPKAIVGEEYSLFKCSAHDVTGKKLTVKTKIYYGDSGVQVAFDGDSFTPPKAGKYTVEYTVVDRYGYAESKSYVIWATLAADAEKLTVQPDKNSLSATTGLNVALPAYATTGGSGNITVDVALYFGETLLKTFAMGEPLTFLPTQNGTYTVQYTATDYVGNVAMATVTVSAQAQLDPIFDGDALLQSVMVDGWTYTLPALYAWDYTGEEPQKIKAKITVYDNRDGYVLEDCTYTPSVDGSQTVRIVYSVQTDNGYAEKEYYVQVQKTQNGNGICIQEYFVGKDVVIKAEETGVCVAASANNASFRFINPLLISKNGLTLGFNVPQTGNGFDLLNVYLTDSENVDNTVKLTLYKGSLENEMDASFTTLKVNDEKTEYRVPGSFLNGNAIELIYEETYRWITASNGVKANVQATVSGEPFTGFAGRFVYVTFEFGTLSSNKACVNVTKLNNQQINASIVADKIAPQIAVLGEYGGMSELGKETVIRSAVAGDVLAKNVTISVTLTGPSGSGKILSTDGVALENADGTREYTFIPTRYGSYRVTFTAKDANGYQSTTSYNIAVVDNDGPNILIEGEIPDNLQLENGEATLCIPNVSATDDSNKECRIVINLKRPDGTMIRVEEKEVLLTAAGRYVLYVDAYDANGNQTVQSFVVWVA